MRKCFNEVEKAFVGFIVYYFRIIPSTIYVLKAVNINSDPVFLLSGILGITAYYLLSVQFFLRQDQN